LSVGVRLSSPLRSFFHAALKRRPRDPPLSRPRELSRNSQDNKIVVTVPFGQLNLTLYVRLFDSKLSHNGSE
jgi:hypothetical protein